MNCTIRGIRIAGVATAVPPVVLTPAETGASLGLRPEEVNKIAMMTGVHRRRVAPEALCTSDMAFDAATQLLQDLDWDPKSVDALILVTQTPDYDTPATSCCLQERLGLPDTCAAIDIALGCSGYVYGLWNAATMIAAGAAKRALVLVGDTLYRTSSPHDRSTMFLFGDAATATAMEADTAGAPLHFVLGTDGSGREFLILPGTGYRNRINAESLNCVPGKDGVPRSQLDIYMDGSEVFAFTLNRVPSMVKQALSMAEWDMSDVDAFIPHQANQFMIDHLSRRMKVPSEKLMLSIAEYGNTSSASIPLTMSHTLRHQLSERSMNLVLAGFGVGWSWGALAVQCGPMVMSEIIHSEVPLAEVRSL